MRLAFPGTGNGTELPTIRFFIFCHADEVLPVFLSVFGNSLLTHQGWQMGGFSLSLHRVMSIVIVG